MAGTVRPLSRGYTVLEVALVAMLLSITLVVTARFWLDLQAARRVEATARVVAGHLRLAQTLAMSNAVDWMGVRVTIAATIRLAPLRRRDGTALPPVRESDPLPPAVVVRALGARSHVDFASSGAPTVGSNQTLVVESRNARRYVVVTPGTGRVRVTTSRP